MREASGSKHFQVFPDPHFPRSVLTHTGEGKFREGVGEDWTRIGGPGDDQAFARFRNGLHVGIVKN